MPKKNILLTGAPGIGKTTVIRKIAEALKEFRPAGFYTAEIREAGARKGFELISLDGRGMLLSHVGMQGVPRVGRYGVDLGSFEEFLNSLPVSDPDAGFFVIDEIGKMECLSQKFCSLIRAVLDSSKPVVATIALRGQGFIAEVKKRRDVTLIEVSEGNRDVLALEVAAIMKDVASCS